MENKNITRNKFKEEIKLKENNSANENEAQKQIRLVLSKDIDLKTAVKTLDCDEQTLRRKLVELVKKDRTLDSQYIKFLEKNRKDYGKIDFKKVIQVLIQNQVTQTEISKIIGVPRRTIGRELEKLKNSENEEDINLYKQYCYMADNIKKNEYDETEYKKEKIERDLKQIDIYTGEDKNIATLKKLEEKQKQILELKNSGMTVREISQKLGVSNNAFRRINLEIEEIKLIMKIKEKESKVNENEK